MAAACSYHHPTPSFVVIFVLLFCLFSVGVLPGKGFQTVAPKLLLLRQPTLAIVHNHHIHHKTFARMVLLSATSTSTSTIEGEPSHTVSISVDENNDEAVKGDINIVEVEQEVPSKRKLKRIAKAQAKVGWKEAVQDFKDACLDQTSVGVHYAVRSTLIQGAAQYPRAPPASSLPSSSRPDDNSRRGGTLLPGTHKHLGGAYDPASGAIFGIPANGRGILTISKAPVSDGNDEMTSYQLGTIPLPEHVAGRQMKWLRGIVCGRYLWAIPAWANAVLRVDLQTWREQQQKRNGSSRNDDDQEEGEVVRLIPLPESHPNEMRWQWHGGALNDDETAIYCVPSNARYVLKIDIVTMTTSFIDIEYDQERYPDFTLDCTNKWYGGIRGDDNCIYGSPYRAAGVLRIDCNTETASMIGPNYGVGKYFWHGGIKRLGKIYAHPSHANTVLVIDTNYDRNTDSGPRVLELPIHRAEYDTDTNPTYNWLGGSVGADGHIYCPSCDSSSVLKINVTTDHVTTFGFTSHDKNKWQGGILSPRDSCIYCIPAAGTHVLRIATDPNIEGENPIQLLGNLPDQKDKWQGASAGTDGRLYFIPENGYRVLRVTPPREPPKIVNGKLPEDDVMIELM